MIFPTQYRTSSDDLTKSFIHHQTVAKYKRLLYETKNTHAEDSEEEEYVIKPVIG